MELWIRSQDREMLLKTTSLCMEIQNDVDPKLHTFNIFANGIRVGNYKSKERAIAILDEIQNILSCKCLLKSYDNLTPEFNDNLIIQPCEVHIEQLNDYVYEMPQE